MEQHHPQRGVRACRAWKLASAARANWAPGGTRALIAIDSALYYSFTCSTNPLIHPLLHPLPLHQALHSTTSCRRRWANPSPRSRSGSTSCSALRPTATWTDRRPSRESTPSDPGPAGGQGERGRELDYHNGGFQYVLIERIEGCEEQVRQTEREGVATQGKRRGTCEERLEARPWRAQLRSRRTSSSCRTCRPHRQRQRRHHRRQRAQTIFSG